MGGLWCGRERSSGVDQTKRNISQIRDPRPIESLMNTATHTFTQLDARGKFWPGIFPPKVLDLQPELLPVFFSAEQIWSAAVSTLIFG